MNTKQYTPKSWRDIPAESAPAGYSFTILDESGHPVADIPDGEHDEANARLIAAAPALLAACQHALEDLRKLNCGHAEIADVCGIIPELRNAIAQATGE